MKDINITTVDNPVSEGSEKEALKFIFSNCFKSGFGTLSKTEIDLILFCAVWQFSSLDDKSDYSLSKYLQITQQRVRNLKEKSSVKYIGFKREKAISIFSEKISFAKIHDIYFDIPINDIRVKNEVEAILGENDILLHTQLNPKIFRIRIDDFIEIAITIEKQAHKDVKIGDIEKGIVNIIKERAKKDQDFAKKIQPKGKGIENIGKETIKEAMVKGGISFGVDLLASIIPGGAFLSDPTKMFLKAISYKI